MEALPTADIARNMGTVRRPGMGGIFLDANRSKRSVALDFKHDSALPVQASTPDLRSLPISSAE